MLHSNRELFEQAILRTADATGIAASIIEKDYYVTEFLRRMTSYQPDMVFKGGTSLSKCYKLIQRFSEDIDLNVEDRPSEGQRKALKRNILAVVDDLGLSLSNAEEIRSRRDYNRYVINYPALQGATYLKQQLIVETVVSMRAFPNHPMDASSFIYDFLIVHIVVHIICYAGGIEVVVFVPVSVELCDQLSHSAHFYCVSHYVHSFRWYYHRNSAFGSWQE